MSITRRRIIQVVGAAAASVLGFPAIVRGQGAPIRIGLLTIKTGPLAGGGTDMERGLTIFLDRKSVV